nr:hypothetical protein [uncultured Caulobacter sp.]
MTLAAESPPPALNQATAAFLAVLDEQTLEQILADKTGARRLLALADT